MAKRITLLQDFEGFKKGTKIVVRDSKHTKMVKDGIKFTTKLMANTSIKKTENNDK